MEDPAAFARLQFWGVLPTRTHIASAGTCLRACYAMSATDLAHADTNLFALDMRCPVLPQRELVAAYGFARQFPVLIQGTGYGEYGTERGYGVGAGGGGRVSAYRHD
eukprot:2987257-Rhodomonas_salina.2